MQAKNILFQKIFFAQTSNGVNLNKVFVLGNVTRDPEVRAMPSGQQVVNFGIATNRFYTDQQGQKKQDTEFHNIVVFGKLADVAAKYLTKGSLVMIEGRIKTRNWMNQQNVKQYRTEVIAEVLQLGPRGAASGSYQSTANSNQKPTQSTPSMPSNDIPIIEENSMPPAQFVSEEPGKEDEIDVKDIPF